MFNNFRQSMAWLHTWSGLLLCWLLFFIFVTGSLGYFDNAIDRWMKPELPYIKSFDDLTPAIDAAQSYLQEHALGADSWYLTLPEPRHPYLHAQWRGELNGEAVFDGEGNKLPHRETGGGQWLYALHFKLHYLPIKFAYWIVCGASLIMLIALISGVIIHKKIFIDFFTFRSGKRARTWLDLHNLLSVSALPFHLMITYSGLLFLSSTFQKPLYDTHYGVKDGGYQHFYNEFFGPSHLPPSGSYATPTSLSDILADAQSFWQGHPVRLLTVAQPNDKNSVTRLIRMIGPNVEISDRLYYQSSTGAPISYTPVISFSKDLRMLLVNLHEGLFADTGLRWLFFISGLAGAGMIATGLIVWMEKRRQKREETVGYNANEVIERANIGVLLGTPIAVVTYFWANRLIPSNWPERAILEQNSFFIALFGALIWSLLRGRGALRHLLWLTAFLYGLLPWVDYWLGGAGVINTLMRGDITLLSFNLVLIMTAILVVGFLIKNHCANAIFLKKYP